MKKFWSGILSIAFVCCISMGFISCDKKSETENSVSDSVSEFLESFESLESSEEVESSESVESPESVESSEEMESSENTESSEGGDVEHSCSFGAWYETEAAKCEEDGEERRDCDCGEFETRPITQTGHSYEDGVCGCGDKYISAGLLYTPSPDNSYYTVTGRGSCDDEVVYIPETYEEKPVKAVGANAFKGQPISGVVLPDCITSIKSGAFENCSSLVNVQLGKGVTEIEDGAFTLCINITAIVLPETLETVGNGAFEGCAKLQEVKIPDKVQSLGNNAFKGCSALENVQLGSGLMEIGDGAFTLCINITVIILGENVTVMGENVFDGCEKLLGVLFAAESMPDGWAENAVPEDILYAKGDWEYTDEDETETDFVFYGEWTAYKEAKCGVEGEERRYGVNDTEKYQSRPIKALEHAYTDYKSNGDATCTEDGTKTATCDNGCGEQDAIADEGSKKGHSYTDYKSNGDATCTEDGTKTATCDNGCGEQDTVADEGSKKGHSYTDYKSNGDATCTEDGTKTATCDNGCGEKDTVTDEAGHDYVDSVCSTCGITENINGLLFQLNKKKTEFSVISKAENITTIFIPSYINGIPVTRVDQWAFTNEDKIGIVFIPNTVTSIGFESFMGCSGLRTVVLGNGLERIEPYAFDCYDGITNVYYAGAESNWNNINIFEEGNGSLLNAPREYGNNPSEGLLYNWQATQQVYTVMGIGSCTDTALNIPKWYQGKPVVSIGDKAFMGNTTITSLTLPNSITSIDYGAFEGCSSLIAITIPDSVQTIDEQVFYGCSSAISLNIGSGVTEIRASAFQNCVSLTEIFIPGTVKKVGSHAFWGCNGANSLTLSEGVGEIGAYSFYGCSSVKSVVMPSSLYLVGEYCFTWCSSMESVSISSSLIKLENYMFAQCKALTNVVIPNHITYIGACVFLGCEKLSTVTIGAGVNCIDPHVFADCPSLSGIYFTVTTGWRCATSPTPSVWDTLTPTSASNPVRMVELMRGPLLAYYFRRW